ncbi:DUF3616 domain-containing protein [Granulosicoccus antarcticus]|uniref:Phytase-like domain-containing protein n=1 Tax=Granulosicoccus antarcticus IMCC3135 TaxID=1192854 RepID=A0A2Z2NKR2_9GAMM|nr:DUF3616 domain-containing protein [Granulosicoccus antarcticus]ASJ71896.1 hypothetical protein IMCC3135_08995 [Granulosicoccus antarcticus IMCC3135]
MDKSLTTPVNHSRKPEPRTVPAFILAIIMVSAGSTGRASTPQIDQEKLIDPSTNNLSMKLDGSFTTLYEPSGIAPLPNGRFLIVEDEPAQALRLVTAEVLTGNAVALKDETRLELPSSLTERLSVGVLDDLEGAAHDQLQQLYIISSHDDSTPYWSSERQKLLRFSIRDGRMHNVSTKLTLRRDLLKSYPQLATDTEGKSKKKAASMNIEALAYDRSRDVLLIGFRTPVLNGNAIIIRLKNPAAYFNDDAQPELDKTLWSVDLDKGGLRAMTYDDQSDQLLLISRRENHKDDSYKLWRLPAAGQEPAIRIELGEQEEMLKRVEGLALMDLDPSPDSGVLFVRDNGNTKKKQGGDWFILTRKQLGLNTRL